MKTTGSGWVELALRMMRPLIRVLMKQGVSYGEFTKLARHAYVDVARSDCEIPGRKLTTSRIAVVTGLSRKEVVRLIDAPASAKDERERSNFNRAYRVVNGWLTDPKFRDRNGVPRALTLKKSPNSFAALVKKYSGDITARAILDELVQSGAVRRIDRTTVELCEQGYMPLTNASEKLDIAATCTADLLGTLDHNLCCDAGHARFQRQVTYHDLPRSAVERYRELNKEKSNALLVELNAWLANEKRKAARNTDEPRGRVGTGIYYFEDEKHGGGE